MPTISNPARATRPADFQPSIPSSAGFNRDSASALDTFGRFTPRNVGASSRTAGLLSGLSHPVRGVSLNTPSITDSVTIDITDFVTGKNSQAINHPERKRAIGGWIPGNQVRSFAHAEDPTENHGGILSWLRRTSEFSLASIRALFAEPETTHAWEVNNPILQQPIAEDLRNTIRGANETLFIDIFLMGGTWGLDIVKEVLLATERGVKVVMVRDTDNTFSSGFEMTPLWEELEAVSYTNPNLTVLRSDIHQRPSGLPFGLESITEKLEPWIDMPLSLSAKSDHSKVVIADGLTPTPSMWVGSKNTVDSGGSYFFDEVMHIDGPAAAAAQVSYLEDIQLAHRLAVRENRNGGQPSDGWVREFVDQLSRRKSGEERTRVNSIGDASVQLVENNADDSIRNVESSVLALIEGAKTSINMYQFLAYSPSIAKALARAIRRGVEVRLLMDSIDQKVPLNNMLAVLMKEHGVSQNQIEASIRWRSQLPGGTQFDFGEEFPIEPQQQHTKTIIIDDQVTFAGSANFDIASLSGAFREFSVAVKDEETAAAAVERFDAIFESDEHSRPYQSAFPQPMSFWEVIAEKVVRDILVTESWRIGNLDPAKLFR